MLYCLSAESGSLLWKAQSALSAIDFTRSSVVVEKDQVLTGGAFQVSAYHKETGALLWESTPCNCENTPGRWVADRERNRLIVGAHWRMLYAIDLKSGQTAWEQSCRGCWFRTTTPLVQGDKIYTFGLDRAIVLDADTGALITEKAIGCAMDVSAAPVLENGILYAATADSGVIALDAESLQLLRRFPTRPAGLFTSPYQSGLLQTVESTPQIQGESLIFAASDGGVYFYDRNTAALQRRIQLGAPSTVSPLLTADGIITVDFQGTVRKYKM